MEIYCLNALLVVQWRNTALNKMIIINGKKYNGNSVSIVNNKVYVDGKEQEDLDNIVEKDITIIGNVHDIDCHNLKVKGNITGDVDCHNLNITGDIKGDVDAHNVIKNE